MYYELVAQCSPKDRHQVIQKIEMSGGRIRDILEDQDKLLLFIEYDEPSYPQRLNWLEILNNVVNNIGDAFTFPNPAV